MLYWTKIRMMAFATIVLLMGGVVGMFMLSNARAAGPAEILTGIISQVREKQITLDRKAGPVVVEINEATVIKVDDKPATAADLKAGMASAITVVEGTPATEIRAYSPKQEAPPVPPQARIVTGRISQFGDGFIAIQPNKYPVVTIPINANTIFTLNDKPATEADLKIDLDAGVQYEPGMPALEIHAYTRGTPPGR